MTDASLGANPKSIASAVTKDRLRYPCAIVAWNGLSLAARSTSTWIHCRSPVHSANWSILDWSTSIQSDVPRLLPTKCSTLSSVISVMIGDTVLTDDRAGFAAGQETT